MRIDILTLFPGMFQGPLTESILQRAQEKELLDIRFHDLREFGLGKYHQVDDAPYGGGAGMVMRADVIVPALEAVVSEGEKGKRGNKRMKGKKGSPWRIYFSPRGKKLKQTNVERLAKCDWLILLCGHYEGIDQRIIDGGWIDEEVSIGDYVLTGGELPAMVLVDAIARQIPGVLGKDESATEESFSASLNRKKEYPHYTRPEEFRGLTVPDVLLSGHHKEIEKWRKANVGGRGEG
ncbi:MAG TPA: tRNA (guanosine(37)-N1)-methyltransferase TrmD [Candidatus Peribacter riflensis]|uniref:tRNA (guanine-N(1)-)-methyltransferase n=1 Tax=Candidatus Peribacter riflensis TaxID=1735162 RepID=A0A0S1SP66_9BACT|nr:MAG: tRNA (guanine-N1)-methyltransferase [Candidatus Peribacter riflensis]OGJ77704.1 MAG: tRNA (guanosine(37)-N1)-methyltransferase TrmD [Candidatus Peribacteria bacterium RIFOXYB1_FULL_57_12]OGJ79676.1 MAG: tRNA (guanosine(37)-N1)-methyltransferase TrmD [Candidatus Peribacteria bacterium RIFOXYC1_FULL_58_8]ALM11315.1 MAG: tRNA (guanine-N1)-methyltransferase [Candidatus Peribacter riflensis]ALM12417.1 MAG: tRNA (guanine-N1)-methyltransferase [Candidatus Peribacter riflensis]